MSSEEIDTEKMNIEALLSEHFSSLALPIILEHSRFVADKALQIARNAPCAGSLDLVFIEEAALLHDIGVSLTDSPFLDCHGLEPYICHGVLGRALLEKAGLPKHALVCERHIGVGLTVEDIISQNLPLPHRDMLPLTSEEKIIALADLFYSKKKRSLSTEKSIEQIRNDLAKFSESKVRIFNDWLKEFAVSE